MPAALAKKYNPNWRKWHEAGYTEWLLPIGPVNAPLSPNTGIKQSDGKIPMVKNRGLWSGYRDWTKHRHTEEQVKMFSRMGANIGLNAAVFNGGDVDVEDAELAEAIVQAIIKRLGPTAVRYRDGSARRLLMYQTGDDIHKIRLAWRGKGGVVEAFEWLGTGQQFVCEGMHKSGEFYKWLDPHPCDLGVFNIPSVKREQVMAVFGDVRDLVVARGYEFVARKEGSTGGGKRKPLTDASLHAPSPQCVLDVLKAVPCNDETFQTRDDFVLALAAIKAALGGGGGDEHWGDVLEWAMQYPGAEPDYIEKIWASIKDAAVGWDYLSAWARGHGYHGDAQADFADEPADKPAAVAIPETPLERALARYVWCAQIERYVDLETNTTLSAKAFNAANVDVAEFGRRGMESAEAVFQNADEVCKADIITYRPGQGPLITDKNASGKMVQAVNMWRPSSIVPAKNVTDDDVRPWLDHVALIFGPLNEPAAVHFLDCVAFKLQHPGVKINHAILLWGATQGTGKDSVFVPIFRIIGDHQNVQHITPEMLAGQFTPYLQCEVIVVEEMMNFERRATANKMKPNLACPPHTVTVNQKHIAPYTIPNIQWWVIFSNYEDAVPIEETDRRYWVHRCSLETPRDPAYYEALFAFYDNGGVEKIAGWLLARNVQHFNPAAPPPMTGAKRDMITATLPRPVQWLLALLVDEGRYANRRLMISAELEMKAISRGAPPGINHKSAAAALRAAGFELLRRVTIDGNVRTLWARDPSGLLGRLSPDQLRERYLLERNRPTMDEVA